MKIYKDIPEGGVIPKGYGVSWRYSYNLYFRCYPIPLNILVRASKDFCYWLMRGCWHSRYERELLQAHVNGIKQRKETK